MAIERWHPGKVLLIWGLVVLLTWPAFEIGKAWWVIEVIVFLSAFVLTWRWLGFRERSVNATFPLPALAPTSAQTPTDVYPDRLSVAPRELAARLYGLTDVRPLIQDVVEHPQFAIVVDRARFYREILGLRMFAVELATLVAFGGETDTRDELLEHFDAIVLEERGDESPQAWRAFLKQRSEQYLGGIPNRTNLDIAEIVGGDFAVHCESDAAWVQQTGAKIFYFVWNNARHCVAPFARPRYPCDDRDQPSNDR